MSKLTQFTVTGKEKDEFYGFHRIPPSQTIRRTVTKVLTGTSRNDSIYEYALSTPYNITTASLTTTTSLTRRGAENANQVDTSDIRGLTFNSDGSKMYVGDKVNHRIIQYTLTTPYNVKTLIYAR